MTVTAREQPELKRQYPHVDNIDDWRARQSIRLLWDRVFDLEARLQASEGTVGDLVTATNEQQDAITLADRKADEALAIAQTTSVETDAAIAAATDLVWAWVDRGGNPVVAPVGSVGPPTTDDEWRDYVYSLLGETLGTEANDYEAVLQGLIDGGMMVNAEPGVVPDVGWPYFGIQVIVDGGGHPRGRLQLPTAIDTVGDGSGYYTHEFQVIADA